MDSLTSLGKWFLSKDLNTSMNTSLSTSLQQHRIGKTAEEKWQDDQASIEQRAYRSSIISFGLIALSLGSILSKGFTPRNIFGIYLGIEIGIWEAISIDFYKNKERSISMHIDVKDPSITDRELLEEAKKNKAACWDEFRNERLTATLLWRVSDKISRWLDS